MQPQLNPETLERLDEQAKLLLRLYQAEFAKNSTSRATESARSNLIALSHTVNQIYGESAAFGLTSPPDLVSACASVDAH
jgi:hypothetical protein